MWAGKSSELLRRVRRHTLAGASTLVLKFAGDTRYDAVAGADRVSTHDGRTASAVCVSRLGDAAHYVAGASVIGIDEGQVPCGNASSAAGFSESFPESLT